MRRLSLTSTGLLALAISTQVAAEIKIDSKKTDAQNTSKANNGKPDSIRITDKGAVTLKSGNAVTIDSSNAVTNEGSIQITDADGANGIYANAGVAADISNKGKITLDETYKTDGKPFAKGSRRAGIRTAGAMTGTISNAGEISVQGNDSAGIWVGGPLTGSLTQDGKVQVTGDRAIGVRLDRTTGNVTLGGTIAATGRDAVGARIDGDVGGALLVQGGVTSTGYRYTKPPSDTSKLTPDDLLQGGSALVVSGNVTGGITLTDTKGKSAEVTTYGAAPAVLIGATGRDVAIGAGTGTNAPGLAINGKVTGDGVYSGAFATGVRVGGQGGAVTIANGVSVGGTVTAKAVNASATAMNIGAKANMSEIKVGGSVTATGGAAGTQATAILVDAGAAVPKITNAGNITATAGGTAGAATAILDRSGSVKLVDNGGTIATSGADGGRNVAIDLSANTSGATVRQAKVAGGNDPSIAGNIRFGSGDDVLDVSAGSVKGDVSFGAGSNRMALSGTGNYAGTAIFGGRADTLAIGGTARFTGTADFGGGKDTLAITDKGVFSGRLLNAGSTAVTVAPGGGTFAITSPSTVGSLTLGNGSILGMTLDKANAATPLLQVNGTTTIGAGSKLALQVDGANDMVGRYIVLRSGTLTGAGNLTTDTTLVPFLYKGTIIGGTPNQIAIDIARKSADELGLDRHQASAFSAIDAAIDGDAKMATAIRGQFDGVAFRNGLNQMMPNYSGGVFETVTLASRAIASQTNQPMGNVSVDEKWAFWLSPVGWSSRKRADLSSDYRVGGWGIGGGLERRTGLGAFGASFAYLKGHDKEGYVGNRIKANQYEFAGYWRGQWGGLSANARASIGWVSLNSLRNFSAAAGTENVQRKATAEWNGRLYSLSGGVSYDQAIGVLTVRPALAFDYYKLNEDAYNEKGGGKAFDLAVRKRTGDELAFTGTIAAGLKFGGGDPYAMVTRLEIEGGRREVIAGSLGATTASFAGGKPFTLDPEKRNGGWVGKVRASTGTSAIRLTGEVGAEQRFGRYAKSARAGLQLAF